MQQAVRRTSRHPALQAGIGVLVSAACLALVLVDVDLARTWAVIAAASWPLVLASGMAIALDIGVRAWRWQRLLRPIRAIVYRSVLRHTLIGCLVNNVLPARLGEVARSVSLGESEAISRTTVLGTVIVERVLDTLVLALLAGGAVMILGVGGVVAEAVLAGVGLALTLGLLLVAALGAHRVPDAWSARLRPTGHVRLRSLAQRLHQGLGVAADAPTVARGAFLSGLAWAVGTGAYWLAAASVGVSLTLPQAALLTAAVSLATAIPSGPGYLGSFELAAVAVLTAFGVAPDAALAAAIVMHATVLLVSSAGGAVALARSGFAGRLWADLRSAQRAGRVAMHVDAHLSAPPLSASAATPGDAP